MERGSVEVLGDRRSLTPASLAPYLRCQWQRPVQRFTPAVRQSRLALIVFPRSVAGATPHFAPVSAATAAAAALVDAFSPPEQLAPARAVASAVSIVERGVAFRLIHGDAEKACERTIAEMVSL